MLKCTNNGSVRGSVPALGEGPGLAGFYPCSLQCISNVGKWIYIIAPNASFFIQKCSKIIMQTPEIWSYSSSPENF